MKRKDFFPGFRFLKCKKSFLLRKYSEFFRGFRLPKYNKNFLWRKHKKLSSIRAGKFHFPKYKEFFSGWIFYFLELGLKSSISQNIRKHKNFFNVRARKFHIPKCNEFYFWLDFVIFQAWA